MLRTRLFSALDASFPVVLVEAVPGAGKRTLLNQWLSADSLSHRLAVDASKVETHSSGAGLVRLIGAEVQRALGMSDPTATLPGEDAYSVLVERLSTSDRPIAVAVLEADCLSKAALAELLHVVEAVDGFQLVLSGFDLDHAADMTRERRVPWARLDEQDLFFTRSEVRTVMQERGIAVSSANVAAMFDSTGGHPGLVDIAIRQLPAESETGTLLSHQPLGAYLNTGWGTWPPAFSRLLRALGEIPRMTVREAQIIAQVECPDAQMRRLQLLGLGEITYHPGLNDRVFTWREWVRTRLVRTLDQVEPPDGGLTTRVRMAAEECGDWELQVASRVRAGDLAGAEQLLENWLWDVLPRMGGTPTLSCIEEIAATELGPFPGLLCIRMRQVSGSLATATMAAVAVERSERLARSRGLGPWQRLSRLVRAVMLAQHTVAREMLIEHVVRARDLAVDLATGVVGDADPARASDLLLLVEVLLQMGNTTAADELAALAIALISTDPETLDPTGERYAFAGRVRLLSHRERGLGDPVDAQPQLSGLQFLHRDADLVAAHLVAVWMAVDDGRFDAADALCRRAIERLHKPREWPVLMWVRLPVLALARHPHELQVAATDYLESRRRQTGRSSWPALSPLHEEGAAMMSRAVRVDCSLPEFIAPTASYPIGLAHPRIEYALALDHAVDELRAGRERSARTFLEQAIARVCDHRMSPVALASATAAEIERLAALIADHPAADKICFDHALIVAGSAAAPAADLTPREREVLALIREGATNTQIAKALFLSVNTVKSHRASLMRKLGAKSRQELLEMATLLGM